MMLKKLVAIVGAACLGASFVAGFMVGKYNYTPKEAYQSDINKNKRMDITVKLNNGDRVFLYDTRIDNDGDFHQNPTYLPRSEFSR
jgi:hypothetical protein